MATHPDYPFIYSFTDNRDTIRWRFRKTGLQPRYLPGEPHTKPLWSAGRGFVLVDVEIG